MDLKKEISKFPRIRQIISLAREENIELYLVGGALRDLFLGQRGECFDFDFVVGKKVFTFARKFSRLHKLSFVVLDKEEGTYRVVEKKGGRILNFDFNLLKGKAIDEDLAQRDFTINSLAVNLTAKNHFKLIDKCNSRLDLRKKTIRSLNAKIITADPLRMLRAFRFVAQLGFRVEPRTYSWIRLNRRLINNVSFERVTEELFKIFSSPFSFAAIKLMDKSRLIDEIIPSITATRGVYQGRFHHLDVWRHSLLTLQKFENLLERKLKANKDIHDYLNAPLSGSRNKLFILKLACILHDIGKPQAKKRKGAKTIFYEHEKIGRDLAEDISRRLKFSSKERELLKKLIFWHLRPGYLADTRKPSERGMHRFFRDTDPDGEGVILLSLDDWRATRGPLTDEKKRRRHERIMLNLIDRYFLQKKQKPLPKLIDGYQIMAKFALSPSPFIGKIIKKIKEEQALGNISTKKEALQLAKKIVRQNK